MMFMEIVLDDMTADLESNKKLSPIVNELFSRRIKLNFLLVFISQYYFKVPKTIRTISTPYVFIEFLTNERISKYCQVILSRFYETL